MAALPVMSVAVAPPSVLPDISPTRGEIGLHRSSRPISPLVGEMPGKAEGGVPAPTLNQGTG